MLATAEHGMKPISGGLRLAAVDASSWISWGCYAAGLILAAGPAMKHEFDGAGAGAYVLAGSIAVFFVLAAAIQRHMRLSLLAHTFGVPAQLVTGGVFRYSRNPIYVAFLIPVATLGYFSIAAALVSAILYVLSMTVFVIRHEESVLERKFGAEYTAYKASVPRWL